MRGLRCFEIRAAEGRWLVIASDVAEAVTFWRRSLDSAPAGSPPLPYHPEAIEELRGKYQGVMGPREGAVVLEWNPL